MFEIAETAIEAYGGKELWQNSQHIEAEVSTRGLAFTLKRRPFFKHAKIKMEIHRPYSELTPIGKKKNITGVLNGFDVQLKDETGKVVAERKNAKQYFPFGRRLFKWDDLDQAFFANYAFWNYFTLPALLMNPKIDWKQKAENVLQATFPDSIPTHNKVQDFYFDPKTGLLNRHDYTVDIISKHASPANVIHKHEFKDGFVYGSKRIVTPINKKNIPKKGPVLIDIDVHSFKLV